METADGSEIGISEVKNVFHEAYAKIVAGEMEDDGFNRLVLLAPSRLARDQRPARLCQISAPGRHRLQPDLYGGGARPQCAARAPPGAAVPRAVRSRQAGDRRRARPDQRAGDPEGRSTRVTNLDEDRILRRFLNLIQSTLRTNFFQGRPAVRTTSPSSSIPHAWRSCRCRARWWRSRSIPARRGDPSARRQGGARRHPLVRPARGFPHRGAGPDEGPDGEERRHRPGRLQGRLRGQAPAARAAAARRSRPRSSNATRP